ncbi:uncharacterized protein BT62DRAFT_584596 [Guyanagaster necrorhizus]|uniref:Uncharacterized protein n=1 Tax=Guyanagaster necrorhizus TaxID=856835 RepID=A0A9P8AM82_9AGAR|nr:uncharacterized protein BT62DRAFT_584596 [Guyanagaster necrorhizus MCA 3950]KAG7440464.1 hypothetical protein BT62DRAFT_584596 [Guyanagaster necrorhizus MCA 3950]
MNCWRRWKKLVSIPQYSVGICFDGVAEQKIKIMRSQLHNNRNAAFFLTVLEKKESMRRKRIAEITALLRRLKEVLEQRQFSQLSVPPVPPEVHVNQTPTRRMTHSRDAITNIEAYYVALSRVALSVGFRKNEDYLPRLKIVMQRHLSSRDAQIDATIANVVQWARKCSHEKAKYRTILQNIDVVSDVDLDRMESYVQNCEGMLQGLCQHSSSLLFAVNPHIKYMDAFQNSAIHVLRESLGDKAYPKGYLDDQRRSLVEQVPSDSVTDRDKSLAQNAKQILKASQAVNVPKLLQDLESLILSIDKRKRISALIRSLPESTESHEEQLSQHRTDSQKIEDGAAKFLQRKLDKASMGAGLVKDIEALLDEAKFIIGQST